MFQALYDKALSWSRHRHALKYLCALSFAESSFFPIPPDVMLAPMALGRPQQAFQFALWTTVFSVLGGILGYAIGFFMFDQLEPWLKSSHYWDGFLLARQWFVDWGFWAVLVAGFSPIPYKVFTIAAGVMSMVFLPFVLASTVGRGARFFLVSLLIAAGGEKLEARLREYMDRLGWVVVGVVVVGGVAYNFMGGGQ